MLVDEFFEAGVLAIAIESLLQLFGVIVVDARHVVVLSIEAVLGSSLLCVGGKDKGTEAEESGNHHDSCATDGEHLLVFLDELLGANQEIGFHLDVLLFNLFFHYDCFFCSQ